MADDRSPSSRERLQDDELLPLNQSTSRQAVTDPETVFQPVVSLRDLSAVGYEALSRWSENDGRGAEQAFVHAEEVGFGAELDRRCIYVAVDTALTIPLPERCLLLINTEPTTVLTETALEALLARGTRRFQVALELTERRLRSEPRVLLSKIAALRARGIAIALDDVGRDPDVLAWLDVIDPDIVKLDLSLIQRLPAPQQARILSVVYTHHERSGAMIVAEGIETTDHLDQALAVGATLGQGFRFGRPATAAAVASSSSGFSARELLTRRGRVSGDIHTPFDLLRGTASVRVARKPLLAALSRDIEAQAESAADRPLVLTAIQHSHQLSDRVRDRYRRLARSCALVAVYGQQLPAEIVSGVRGIHIEADDPLAVEWTIIILGSHNAYALIARELPGRLPAIESARRFEFVVTTDRTLVAKAAGALLARIP